MGGVIWGSFRWWCLWWLRVLLLQGCWKCRASPLQGARCLWETSDRRWGLVTARREVVFIGYFWSRSQLVEACVCVWFFRAAKYPREAYLPRQQRARSAHSACRALFTLSCTEKHYPEVGINRNYLPSVIFRKWSCGGGSIWLHSGQHCVCLTI